MNTETTIPVCNCFINETVFEIFVIIIIVIVIVCSVLVLFCLGMVWKKRDEIFSKGKDSNNINKAVEDKEFEDDPLADFPMLPNDDDIVDYEQNNINMGQQMDIPPLPAGFFDDDGMDNDDDDDEFW
eukprot:409400_1